MIVDIEAFADKVNLCDEVLVILMEPRPRWQKSGDMGFVWMSTKMWTTWLHKRPWW